MGAPFFRSVEGLNRYQAGRRRLFTERLSYPIEAFCGAHLSLAWCAQALAASTHWPLPIHESLILG